MAAPAGQKAQVGPVGVIHQQGHAVSIADGREGRDILHPSQVIRAGEIYGGRRLREIRERLLQIFL